MCIIKYKSNKLTCFESVFTCRKIDNSVTHFDHMLPLLFIFLYLNSREHTATISACKSFTCVL